MRASTRSAVKKTSNVQRRTPNIDFRKASSAFSIRRWAFGVFPNLHCDGLSRLRLCRKISGRRRQFFRAAAMDAPDCGECGSMLAEAWNFQSPNELLLLANKKC